ncbi:hypothetical protein BGZ65_006370 [Modicella reniformis]|uniref:GATA-type domain-containing protein n=1 Tax=Modicella reniformis TaxID=1440133 RepID=A0A9P6MKK0_9FUNG|nr:hypothetical protein BGZ65_006370 [Modicella reniformis]
MSSVKDAVTSAPPQEKIPKRPANFTPRQESRHLKSRENDRQALHGPTTDSRDSAAPHASPNHSRQTWTHAAFSKYIPGSDIAEKGHYQLHHHLSHAHTHTSATSGLSLVGVCTVLIDPYTFMDTKFYTAPSPTLDVKSESQLRHQVVMEFKDNPGALWLFPEEASLEFTPANDCKSAQISASFCLPVPVSASVLDKSESGDQDNTKPFYLTITLVIQHATTALREGLELAVKGTKTTVHPSSHKPKDPPSRPHTPSTYSEDPSEILGSGKQSVNNNSSTAKRKHDAMNESQKSLKPKRTKDHDDKTALSKKKTGGVNTSASAGGGSKKNGLSGSSSNPAHQKRCGYCNCTTTPMWRRGPNGPSTLCNACGVKWKHGKILQDVQDTQQTPKSGGTSSNSGSSTTARVTSKPTKNAAQTGNGRHNDGIQAESSASKRRLSSSISSSSSSHATSRRDIDTRSGDKSGSRESNKRSRAAEPERIVPVKKRHSSKAASASPPGPRMVSIHELGDPARTPFEVKKHEYDDEEDEELQLPNGRFESGRNGLVHCDYVAGTTSSSASTISTQSDMAITGLEDDKGLESSTPNVAADDDISWYPRHNSNLDTATFPLQFPTISIAFGPRNAFYSFPNCAVILHENHFQIKLVQAGEKTEIEVWKEGIEGTEFEAVNDDDGVSTIIMKVLLRQYITRFEQELLNPDRNESLIEFQFREQLDGGGPSVKPLLKHWLTTEIPTAPSLSNDSNTSAQAEPESSSQDPVDAIEQNSDNTHQAAESAHTKDDQRLEATDPDLANQGPVTTEQLSEVATEIINLDAQEEKSISGGGHQSIDHKEIETVPTFSASASASVFDNLESASPNKDVETDAIEHKKPDQVDKTVQATTDSEVSVPDNSKGHHQLKDNGLEATKHRKRNFDEDSNTVVEEEHDYVAYKSPFRHTYKVEKAGKEER